MKLNAPKKNFSLELWVKWNKLFSCEPLAECNRLAC